MEEIKFDKELIQLRENLKNSRANISKFEDALDGYSHRLETLAYEEGIKNAPFVRSDFNGVPISKSVVKIAEYIDEYLKSKGVDEGEIADIRFQIYELGSCEEQSFGPMA